MRRPGAAALDLAWVACGRLDGFWEFGLSPWDMAAGTLLITEAGGLVADLAGESRYLDSATSSPAPEVFSPLLQVIQSHGTPALPIGMTRRKARSGNRSASPTAACTGGRIGKGIGFRCKFRAQPQCHSPIMLVTLNAPCCRVIARLPVPTP